MILDTITRDTKQYPSVTTYCTDDLATPLVLSIPHSGEIYPDDFKPNPTFLYEQYDRPADRYVHELFKVFADLNIPTVKAEFPRVYLDVNRRQYDLATEMMESPETWSVEISRTTDSTMIWKDIYGVDTYNRKLSNAEIRGRIASCYIPYHQTLTSIVEQTRQKYGVVYLLDCHSMLQHNVTDGKERPQIDIGTRGGTSCDDRVMQFLKESFEERGYYVGVNERFAGGEVTQRYGWPECHQHALQIEFRRDLYMDEDTRKRNANFEKLQSDCCDVLVQYNAYLIHLN